MRQAITQHKLKWQNWSSIYIKNVKYKRWSTSVLKKEKYKSSPQANSLLPPQHHRRRRLVEVLLSRPPLGDLSSPKEVDEPRSPKKRLGHSISGRSWKGMTLGHDSLPSSSGRHTAAQSSSAWRAPCQAPTGSARISQSVVGLPPPKSVLGCSGPCRAPLRPWTSRTSPHRLGPVDVQAPLWPWLTPSGLPPTEIKTNK